jgi:hypothetical protein
MAELSDIKNDLVRQEIEEFVTRPEEIARNVALFSRAHQRMQEIAAGII